MNIKTCVICPYFIDDLENGSECGNPNGCIYDKENQKMKEYKVHWLDGKVEEMKGQSISDAFTNAGYGAGALNAIDWWEEIKEKDQSKTEDKSSKEYPNDIINDLISRYPKDVYNHALRVACMVKDTGYDNDYVNIALLHDILDLEYTETVIEEIPDSYRSDIILLTRTKEETYEQYIKRIADSLSLRAIIIKLYDLRDHLKEETLPESIFDRYYYSRRTLRSRYLYLSENKMANGEKWMHASEEEIENMTWEEARKIIIGQIEMGMDPKDPSCWGPREFLTHALKMVLHKADGN